jgi:hypothetical protein|tara:strand:- start:707 stop:1087 length:381 start_codon:yes stop_codon:yes gene_type:complete
MTRKVYRIPLTGRLASQNPPVGDGTVVVDSETGKATKPFSVRFAAIEEIAHAAFFPAADGERCDIRMESSDGTAIDWDDGSASVIVDAPQRVHDALASIGTGSQPLQAEGKEKWRRLQAFDELEKR